MAQGGEWVTRGYDQSLRSPCDHAYYLGKFLRMDHPEMKTIPTINGRQIVDPIYFKEGPEYECYHVSDKVKSELKKKQQDHAQFEIRDLVHNTSLDDFLSIIEESIIRPSKKERQIEGIGTFRLSWWGLSFDKEITRRYKSEMQKVLFEAGIDYESKHQRIQLLNSSPFCQPSRYGNFRIVIPVSKMIEYYEGSFGECQRRILWTEIFFRCEVDHTILVHPKTPEFSELFKDLPLMDEYLEIQGTDGVIKGIGGKWFWCPQSTSIFHPESKPSECKYKAWDQLTFAFLIPEEREGKKCAGIKIPDEDWEGLIEKVTLHDVKAGKNLSPSKAETKYEAMIRLVGSPSKPPNHLHRALINRFKKLADDNDETIKALDAAIQRLEAEVDTEEEIPAAAVRQKLFS